MKSYKYIKKIVFKRYLSILIAGSISINMCDKNNLFYDKLYFDSADKNINLSFIGENILIKDYSEREDTEINDNIDIDCNNNIADDVDNLNIEKYEDKVESTNNNVKEEVIDIETVEEIVVNDDIADIPLELDKPLYEYTIKGYLLNSYNTREDRCFTMQGAVSTSDKIIISRQRFDSDKTYLYSVNKDTLEIESVNNNYCLGHSNDMCYNPNLGVILVVGKDDYKKVVLLDSETLEYISEFESNHRYFGVAYNQEEDNYVAFGSNKMYVLDNSFNEIGEFDVSTKLTKQSITIKDNLIYYLCWEKGVISLNQTSVDLKRANTSYIFVYDYNGNMVDSYYISNIKGESEGVFFNGNDLLISVNGLINSKWELYKIDINKENAKDKVLLKK